MTTTASPTNASTVSAAAVTGVTADTSAFTFYDIESLSNVFTLCAYTPGIGGAGRLQVFYLVDDAADGTNLADCVDEAQLADVLFASNPGMPAYPMTRIRFYDLRTAAGNETLAALVGLSSAEIVGHRSEPSVYPQHLRPVCDTDTNYDPARHPFLAGYNSMNYDTTMLALYLSEVFAEYAGHAADLTQMSQREAAARYLLERTGHHESSQDLTHARTNITEMQAESPRLRRVDASTMREHNNRLFSAEHIDYMPGALGWESPASKIRRAMIASGRHVDVSRLNELQTKVALKRLLGMLGRQIKESEKLGHDSVIGSLEDLYELLAYNVSDCVGLSQLFRHPAYASNFDLKAGLLAQYTETRYHSRGSIRKDRLSIDSSSAKFVGRILAPEKALSDIESVSFLYPAEEIARQENIPRVNVLDECLAFFEKRVAPDRDTDPVQAAAHEQFMQVVRYYRSIEGKNFNDSDEYLVDHPQGKPAKSLRDLPKAPNNVPYFTAGGKPSSCFATFSTGGIHGAEAHMHTYLRDTLEHLQHSLMLTRAGQMFPSALDFVAEAKRQHNELTLPDGSKVDKRLVLLGSDPEKVRYRKPKKGEDEQNEHLARAQAQVSDPAELLATQRDESSKLDVVLPDGTVLVGKIVLANTTATNASYRDAPAKRKPELFVLKDDGSNRLHPKYNRTSAGLVIHEDFTSYYPNLLRNMRAFYNPELGEDRYATIFFEKERLGHQLKRADISPEEKARLTTLRNGTKLILNSASGAGDAGHKTPIRMNNQIISMRIIGQLFSWRIGQAQTLAGARIISTNTDGLYSVVGGDNGFDEKTNNQVLTEQQAAINIDIEPELMYLISKDSNNRLELTAPTEGASVVDSTIIAAGGGTLACHAGPTPTKSLAHPAVIDLALARYLQHTVARGEDALSEDFDRDLGRKIMSEALDRRRQVSTLLLFQNVIAASRGSITYPFAADPLDTRHSDGEVSSAELMNPRPLQMVNRVFIVKPGTPGAVSLHNAGAWKVPPASQAKRTGVGDVVQNPMALQILRHHGWAANANQADLLGLTQLPTDQDVLVRKINSIDPTWSMVVVNDDLHVLDPTRLDQLLSSLDLEVYTQLLEETFTKNWQNQPTG